LAVSKKNAELLVEIKNMESYLSRLLQQIKISEPFPLEIAHNDENYASGEDNMVESLATYYHQTLNVLLNNLTGGFSSPEQIEPLLLQNRFANLQLIVQK
jgi:hypothetical protein